MAYIGQQPITGSFAKLDDISAGFNGVTTTFNLTTNGSATVAGSAQNLLISLDGVLQDPSSYSVSVSTIIFSEAPASGTSFFGTQFGSVYNLTVPSDSSITSSKIDGSDVLNFRQTLGIQAGGVYGQWLFPTGSTAQRPTGTVGGVRFNVTNDQAEVFTSGSGWSALGGAQAGGVLYETKQNITSNYTLSAGSNAMTIGQFTVADGVNLTVPDGQSIVTMSTDVTTAADNVTPVTNAAQTIYGVKTFAAMPVMPVQSMVRLNTANGYGSTNTRMRRFTNVVTNQGTDITYADSAVAGSTFTINTSGVYAISYSDSNSGSAGMTMGISLNAANPSVFPSTSEILSISTQTVTPNFATLASVTVYLVAGSIIRAFTDGAAGGSTQTFFTITRVS